MRTMLVAIGAACALLGSTETVSAWSATGHMTVTQIAYERLNPTAKAEVDRLIRVLAPFDPQVGHFVPAATWMDMSRGYDINIFNHLHFISLPYNPYGLPSVKPPAERNVVWGINNAITTLNSSKAADLQKALLLRMLIHFVGDVHQPLHATERFSPLNPDGELGGNKFLIEISEAMQERFKRMNPGNPSRYLLKRPVNLHAIWDEIGLLYPFVDPMKPASWQKEIPRIAKEITTRHPRTSLPAVDDLTAMNWAVESNLAGVEHVYVGVKENGKITDAYLENTREVATRRIALAGYRLAAVLNKIFPER